MKNNRNRIGTRDTTRSPALAFMAISAWSYGLSAKQHNDPRFYYGSQYREARREVGLNNRQPQTEPEQRAVPHSCFSLTMSFPLRPHDLAALAFATGVFLYIGIRSRRTQHPLPPSPKGWLPILGHALQIPTSNCWTTFERWGKELNSDIIYLEALGKRIVVVNLFETTKELLESPGRSLIYSDRPASTMVNDLMGYDCTMATLPYNAKWKGQRRLFSKYFSSGSPSAYQPQIKENVHHLLLKLLNNPEDFVAHIQYMVGSTVITLAYSIKTEPVNDPNLKLGLDSVNMILEALAPGRYLVDTISALKYLPEWLPGTGFLQDGKRGRRTMMRILEEPFAAAERLIAEGNARPSLVSMVLDDVRAMKDREEAESTIYAGYDTTQATLVNFILAMVCNPEVQAKARAEVDRVVGRDRLPEFSDQENMPYLRAVMKELLRQVPCPRSSSGAHDVNSRWRQVNTIGVPHLSAQDDIYNGYFIPKNTTIIVNQRALLYDPEVYPQPDRFMPERFLSQDGKTHDPSVRDPQTIVFGFGRRACPGSHIAMADLFMVAASILAIFELSKAKDEHGNVIEPSVDLEANSLICGINPLPFKCCIRPRSKRAEQLVFATAAQYDA
ncbi:hypothetical protein NMY22_g2456 [Coprinellus aureogranulatus]|nr:hypothetical protein NMY22_g2456 [Coprinellus aureogranulatus]